MTHAPSSSVRYFVVWIALVALTVLSWLLSLAHLGSTDIAVALVIACIKTALVMLFFMHLVEERFSIAFLPAVAVFFLLLLLGGVVTDVLTRRTYPKAPAPTVDEIPALSD